MMLQCLTKIHGNIMIMIMIVIMDIAIDRREKIELTWIKRR